MSRFGGDYEEQYPGQGELWEANLQRALSGKRGQAALRDLETALLALPEKKVIHGRVADERGFACAVGLLALHRRTQAGEDRAKVLAELQAIVPKYCECMHDQKDHEDETGRCQRCAAWKVEWEQRRFAGGLPEWQLRHEPSVCGEFRHDPSFSDGDEEIQTADLGKSVGLAWNLSWHLGWLNDEQWYGASDEERYEYLLEWVRKRLLPEAVPA